MYSILYSKLASQKIENFVNSYKNIFLKLYSDTGIEKEDEILKNYEILGDRFYETIKFEIRNIFTQDKIYGISQTRNGKQYTTISINNYRLFVYYEEEDKLRIIEDIEFFKK